MLFATHFSHFFQFIAFYFRLYVAHISLLFDKQNFKTNGTEESWDFKYIFSITWTCRLTSPSPYLLPFSLGALGLGLETMPTNPHCDQSTTMPAKSSVSRVSHRMALLTLDCTILNIPTPVRSVSYTSLSCSYPQLSYSLLICFSSA